MMREMASAEELDQAQQKLMADALGSSGAERSAVAGRVFELDGETWVDRTHAPTARTVEIEAYSAAWFDLLRALPELEPVLRKHDNVVVAGKELSLQVGPEGADSLDQAELTELVRGFRGAGR